MNWFPFPLQSGVTALTYAALNGHLEAVQTLFDHGAMPNIRDIAGLLPLHYACRGGHTDVVREFVSRKEGLTVSVRGYRTNFGKQFWEAIKLFLIRVWEVYRRITITAYW